MLLTLARREEAGQTRWGNVDMDEGTGAIHETQNQQPHIVLLPRQALNLLRAPRPEKSNANALDGIEARAAKVVTLWSAITP